MSSRDRGDRPTASRSCAGSSSTTTTATTSSTTRRSTTAPTTCSSTSCGRSRTSIPSSSPPTRRRSASARPRRRVHEGRAPLADGLAREGHDRGGAREVGRRRAQAPRHRRARRVRPRAEDRRLGGVARLRGRRPRARCDARRRRARGGRHRQSPHDRGDPAAHARRRAARASRGPRRDLLPARRLRALQRGAARGGEEACAERTECGGRLAAPAEPRGDRRATALDLRLRDRRARGCGARDAVGGARMAARARLPDEPGRASASSRSRRSPTPASPGRSVGPRSATRSTGS